MISDTELVCRTPALLAGAYTAVVVSEKDFDATGPVFSVVSSAATITAAGFRSSAEHHRTN